MNPVSAVCTISVDDCKYEKLWNEDSDRSFQKWLVFLKRQVRSLALDSGNDVRISLVVIDELGRLSEQAMMVSNKELQSFNFKLPESAAFHQVADLILA